MAAVATQPAQRLGSLRQEVYAVSNPDIAERVIALATSTRAASQARHAAWLRPLPRPARPADPYLAHLAHDLCVISTFVPAKDEDRGRDLAGPGLWRIVVTLGGWQALHEVPRSLRRRHLLDGLARLRSPRAALSSVPPADAPRPARQPRAREVLERYQRAYPHLYALDVFDLVAHPLTAGAIDFLLARLGAASAKWGPDRVRRSWYILAARCPTAEDSHG